MTDARRWFLALTVGGLMVGQAYAQPEFTCAGNAGVPPLVRGEGMTELVGDTVLNCTGGVPTASGAAVPP